MLAGYALLAAAGGVPGVIAAVLLLGLGVGQLLPLGMARTRPPHRRRPLRDGPRVHLQLGDAAGHARPWWRCCCYVTDLYTALLLTAPLALVIVVAVWRSRPELALRAPAVAP